MFFILHLYMYMVYWFTHVFFSCQIGPIPVDDGYGKEIIAQITTALNTNKTFYTDSNGRDFIKRVCF